MLADDSWVFSCCPTVVAHLAVSCDVITIIVIMFTYNVDQRYSYQVA